MATSTALRFRSRQQVNPVVVLDALGSDQAFYSTALIDSLGVSDAVVATHYRRAAGDRVALTSDGDEQRLDRGDLVFDSLVMTDDILIKKLQSKTVFDSVKVTDEGFITDRDIIRQRGLNDSLEVTDGFQKTVTVSDIRVVNKTIDESVDLSDNVFISTSGIKQRTLLDAIGVTDVIEHITLKVVVDDFDTNDGSTELRVRNRLIHDPVVVADDRIVSRASIINAITISDSFAFFDRVDADSIVTALISAKIEHGIENQ